MSITNFPNGISSYGMPVMPAGVPVSSQGKAYFVDPTRGVAGAAGTFDSPLASVVEAYGRCVANQHDTVYVIAASNSASATTSYLSAKLTWAKDLTHLVGIGAPVAVSQRARIAQTSTATGLSPMLDITADGCMFKNLSIFQGVDDATSLIAVQVTGERNYFENVHFAGGGHATQAVDGGASLKINGGDENLFNFCTIGVDTISAGTGMMGVVFDGEATRNMFYNCRLTMYAGHTGAGFVEVVDGTGIDRYTLFDNCLFINSNSDNFLMAGAFVIPEFAANNSSRILLKDCMLHGVSALDANDRGVLFGNMNDVTGADTSGVAVEMVS